MYNILKIKNNLSQHINECVKVVSYGNRNKVEEYYGVIDMLYNNIFTIKLLDGSTRSFTYRDILIKNIEIFFNYIVSS